MNASSLMVFVQFKSMEKPSNPQHPMRPSGDVAVLVPVGHPKSGFPLLHWANLHRRSCLSDMNMRDGSTIHPAMSLPSYLYQSTSSGPAIVPMALLPLP